MYQKILEYSVIVVDESTEQIQLRLTGLVVQENNQLKVYNLIYQFVFDLEWVGKELEKLRTYSETFKAWIESNYQDESRLLRGQALEEALVWAEGKRLSNDDYKFLDASRELDKKSIQRKLKAQEEVNESLFQARQQAEIALEEEKQASQRLLEARQEEEKINQRLLKTQKNTRKALDKERKAKQLLLEAQNNTEIVLEEEKKANQLLMEAQQNIENTLIEEQLANKRLAKAQKGHTDIINKITFSPNNQFIATASFDNTARLWNLSGQKLAEFKGHTSRVNDVTFSRNSDLVATGSSDNTARLWNLSGQELKQLTGGYHSIFGVNFSLDGQQIVTVGGDGRVRVWDLSGQPLRELKVTPNIIFSVTFSPNGKQIATAANDNMVRLINLSGASTTSEFDLLADRTIDFQFNAQIVETISFSPDGKFVATTEDGMMRIWNLSGQKVAEIRPKPTESKIDSVVFSPDGKFITTAERKGFNFIKLTIWDLAKQPLQKITEFQYHVSMIYGNYISFSPDSKRLVTPGIDKDNNQTVQLRDLSGNIVNEFKIGFLATKMSFSNDGKQIIVVGNTLGADKTSLKPYEYEVVEFWKLSGEKIGELKLPKKQSVMDISNDFKSAVITTTIVDEADIDYGKVYLWKLSGEKLAEFNPYQGVVKTLGFSPNGKVLATSGIDSTIKLWNLKGRQVQEFKLNQNNSKLKATKYGLTFFDENRPRNYVNWMSFSPDGKILAAACNDGMIRLFVIDNSLEDMLERGCNWLDDYLATRPEMRKEICPDNK